MRISDWSSDVCSSDLFAQQRLHSGDLAAKADPREAQALEVLERDRLALHHLAGRDPRDASLDQDRIEARARDRQRVVSAKRVSVRVDLGCRRNMNNKQT